MLNPPRQRGPLTNPLDIGKQGPYAQLGGDFVLGPGAYFACAPAALLNVYAQASIAYSRTACSIPQTVRTSPIASSASDVQCAHRRRDEGPDASCRRRVSVNARIYMFVADARRWCIHLVEYIVHDVCTSPTPRCRPLLCPSGRPGRGRQRAASFSCGAFQKYHTSIAKHLR
jgi:hypothetical protein